MTNQWPASRLSATSATRILVDLLEDPEVDQLRLVQGYLDAKRQLASAFQTLLAKDLDSDPAFGAFVDQLESTMTAMFPQVPAKYRLVSGFGLTHRRLFAYLRRRLDTDVPIDELRILTRDAVHTERRLRELRDLGMQVEMLEDGGRQTCRLSVSTNWGALAQEWISRSIATDSSLSSSQKAEWLQQISAVS